MAKSKMMQKMNEQERDIVLKYAQSMFAHSYGGANGRAGFSQLADHFDDIHAMYIGEHYDESETSEQTAYRPVVNHCFKNTETLYSILRDLRLRPKVYPKVDKKPVLDEEGNVIRVVDVKGRAMLVQKFLDFVWEESRLTKPWNEMMHDACEYGTGQAKVYFDPEGRGGEGLVKAIRCPLKNLFPAETGISDICDQPYMINVIPMSWPEVVRKYGLTDEEADNLLGESIDRDQEDYEDTTELPRLSMSAEKQYWIDKLGESDMLPVNEVHVRYKEAFRMFSNRDSSVKEPESISNKDKLVITYCKDTLLAVENFYEHGKLPFVKFDNYDQPGRYYGLGEVFVAEHINREIDNMWSLIYANIELMGSGRIMKEKSVDMDQPTSDVAEIIEVEDGAIQSGRIQFMSGLSVPSDHFQYIAAKVAELEAVSGISEALAGKPPGKGVESGKAIENLIAAASQRIRPKILNLSATMKEFAEQVLSLALDYYDDRIINIVGPDGAAEIRAFEKEEDENLNWYTIRIEGSQALPLGRGGYMNLLLQLLQVPLETEGVVSPEEIIEASGMPRAYDKVQDLKRRKKEAFERQKQLVETQASAGARAQAQNMSGELNSDNPEVVQQALDKLGIGG